MTTTKTTVVVVGLICHDSKAKTCVAVAGTCVLLHVEAIVRNAVEAGQNYWTVVGARKVAVVAAEKLLVRRCSWRVEEGVGTLNFAEGVVEMSSSGVERRVEVAMAVAMLKEEAGRMKMGEVAKNLAAAAVMMVVGETLMMMNPGKEVVVVMLMENPEEHLQGLKPLEKEYRAWINYLQKRPQIPPHHFSNKITPAVKMMTLKENGQMLVPW